MLEDLDAAVFLSGFVRYERFVALGDFSNVRSSKSGRATVPSGAQVPAEGRLRQTSLTLAGGYRVIAQPQGTVDVLAGFRTWWVRGTVDVGGVISRSRGRSFTDPIIAARVNVPVAERWSVIGQGDVGGFGVGSRSTWQLVGTVNYRATDNLFLSAGYRHLSVDYRSGGTRIDVDLSGPLLGATWRF